MMIRRWVKLFSVQKFDPTKDYYRILGLSPAATPQQLKQAYKDKAKLYHPDVNKGKDALFKDVNEAYQLLSSP
jgi:curved DNA-binding protein CbpA